MFPPEAFMRFKALFGKFSLVNKDLYYKLSVAFSLFFIVPVAGFLFFAVKHEFLNDQYIPFFFLILLSFFFIGFRLLRKLFENISAISTSMTKSVKEETARQPLITSADELGNIVQSFRVLEDELKNKFFHLEKRDRKSVV
jgi:hypothetical protein